MPQNVIEQIVAHAVNGKPIYRGFGPNDWPMLILEYSRVCTRWRDAVLDSRSVFKSLPGHFICIGDKNCDILVREGFLGVAKGVRLSKKATESDVELVRSNFNGKLIEEFNLDLPQHASPLTFDCLTDMVNKSEKAHIFKVEANLSSQREAESVWKLINSTTTVNSLAKELDIELKSQCKIDWSFTTNGTSGEGSIKRLAIRVAGARPKSHMLPRFSSLGAIDTISVALDDFMTYTKSLLKMKTHTLIISHHDHVELSDDMGDVHGHISDKTSESINLLQSAHHGSRLWVKPSAQTICLTFDFSFQYYCAGMTFTTKNTFDVDKTLWSRVRKWLNDVKVNFNSVFMTTVISYKPFIKIERRTYDNRFLQTIPDEDYPDDAFY